ncbi:MAG: GldG family protein [Sideroxydans sp.]|nr:GldG family protein [Sideroxydans sp.]
MRTLFFKRSLFLLFLITSFIGSYQLASRFPLQWDVTQNALNSLDQGSVDALKQLNEPLKITVYVAEQDAQLGDVRKLVTDFVGMYQRYKTDISLTFVDPVKEPDAVRQSGIRGNGEMVVDYAGRREHIITLNQQTLTSALLRLARSKDQLMMYVTGHGERKLDGVANHDLGEFGKRLSQNGYRIAPLNLSIAQDVPSNVGVLLITHPQADFFPGETDKVMRHIEQGGNVLWLIDAEPLRGLEPLAEQLGITLTPGVVVDPAAHDVNAPTDWTLGTGYAPHAITQNFDLITVFPFARALGTEDSSNWEHHVLVEGATNGWVSASHSTKFDKRNDTPGPVNLAIALQREVAGHEQRIVVIGSGAFLSNAYSGNGGNLDLGINILNWLSGEERLITLSPRTTQDGTLTLSRNMLLFMSVGLLVAFPFILIAIGGRLWWLRR